DDEYLRLGTQLVQKLPRARQGVDARDGVLDLRQAQTPLAQDAQAVVHELSVVGFVARGALKLRDARLACEGYPYLGHQHALQIQANQVRKLSSPFCRGPSGNAISP